MTIDTPKDTVVDFPTSPMTKVVDGRTVRLKRIRDPSGLLHADPQGSAPVSGGCCPWCGGLITPEFSPMTIDAELEWSWKAANDLINELADTSYKLCDEVPLYGCEEHCECRRLVEIADRFTTTIRAEATLAATLAERERLGTAANDVLAERERQKSVEGWTAEHDDTYLDGALGQAASCYAMSNPQQNFLAHVLGYAVVQTERSPTQSRARRRVDLR